MAVVSPAVHACGLQSFQSLLTFGCTLRSAANMAKRNPTTGKFEKRADGKIIKPPGWKAPDVEGEMARQFKEGSWSQMAGNSSSTPVKTGRVAHMASPVFDGVASPGAASPVAKKLDAAIAGVAESDEAGKAALVMATATQTENKDVSSKTSSISLGTVGALIAAGFALGAAWMTSSFGSSLAANAATQTV